ncbi:MAG: class I SAM-dependent methyltransferase [Actinomycetota bacterium]|nr:class I SAM-dependent methyltransferase [Actinomycetota bacterium]
MRGLEREVRAEKDVQWRTHPRYGRWESVIPLPPPTLIKASGPRSLEQFLVVGDAWHHIISRSIRKPDSSVLDIGCGCGKIARFLVSNPFVGKYVGFDAMRQEVQWCQNFIASCTPDRFEFLHIDIRSKMYNPRGSVSPSRVVFPAERRSVDVAIAASLFTHLLEPDAKHYLDEIARVLTRDGVAVVSVHVDVTAGVPYVGDERRIDVDPGYFLSLASAAGLELAENLGNVCGQETFVLTVR